MPVGVRGELYIGGESLGRGYLNRPELTAERFVPDPFAGTPGARMYKTGDVVRWRTDGRLEFVGRTDHQVKIRGFRIEPGEVEQVLREHPLLADAAVVPRERSPGDLQLVAYTVGRDGESPTAAEMRQFLRERLPEFMIPTAFVALDALPQTTSGKVDRRALPEPEWSTRQSRRRVRRARARRSNEQLAAIWSEVLNVERVGRTTISSTWAAIRCLALRLTSRVRSGLLDRHAAGDDLRRADAGRDGRADRGVADDRAAAGTSADRIRATRRPVAGLVCPGAVLVRAADFGPARRFSTCTGRCRLPASWTSMCCAGRSTKSCAATSRCARLSP